jgi:hypothetical protein
MGLIADFKRHGATIRTHRDLWDFVENYPRYFREMTEEDIRNGLQTLETMWWEYWRLITFIPQRSLNPRYFRR